MHVIFRFVLLILLGGMPIQSWSQHDPVKAAAKEKHRVEKEWARRDKQIDKVVNTSLSMIGTPYEIGGNNQKGIDEQHFAAYVFKHAGVHLSLDLDQQAAAGSRKYIGEIKKGDLLFFALTEGSQKIASVGVVTNIVGGDVYFVQCTSLLGVKQHKLNDAKWKSRYIKATRLIPEPA